MATFISARARDMLAKQLADLANNMLRVRKVGHDGRYYPSDRDIEDVLAAASVVARSSVEED